MKLSREREIVSAGNWRVDIAKRIPDRFESRNGNGSLCPKGFTPRLWRLPREGKREGCTKRRILGEDRSSH